MHAGLQTREKINHVKGLCRGLILWFKSTDEAITRKQSICLLQGIATR